MPVPFGEAHPGRPARRLRGDPEGRRNKYEYDERLGRLILDRTLTERGLPVRLGFLLDTIGEDNDPVDALILVRRRRFPAA